MLHRKHSITGLLLYRHTILELYFNSYSLFPQICLELSSEQRWELGPGRERVGANQMSPSSGPRFKAVGRDGGRVTAVFIFHIQLWQGALRRGADPHKIREEPNIAGATRRSKGSSQTDGGAGGLCFPTCHLQTLTCREAATQESVVTGEAPGSAATGFWTGHYSGPATYCPLGGVGRAGSG